VAMLRLLALCERQSPETGGVGPHGEHPPLTHEGRRGYIVAVVPWSDQSVATNTVHADRVLHATQLEELTHAF
ncbi:MAG TPA: hypothetical protein VNS88_09520, partial [Nitrospiraceae bacterium]|nr:hypothetical protein [Nitrospiraceae bacterium]